MRRSASRSPGRVRHRLTRGPLAVAVVSAAALAALTTACSQGREPGVPASDASRATAAPSSPPGTGAAASGTTGAQERASALADLLQRRADALLAGDRAGWLAAVDPAADAFEQRQAWAYDALAQLPLASWSYTVLGASTARPADTALAADPESWVARVELSYQVAGADPVPARRVQALTVVRRAEGWRLADDVAPAGAGRTDVDLWDLGEVQVAQGTSSVVVAAETLPRDAAQALARTADTAVAQVDRVWGSDWPRRVVVVVPASVADLAALLGRDPGATAALAGLAAVTTGRVGPGPGSGEGEGSGRGMDGTRSDGAGADGTGTDGTGVDGTASDGTATSGNRVLVNYAAYDGLTDAGQAVVLTHEIAHVATRAATTAPVPGWLVEGFADYVGFRSSGLPVQTAAEEALDEARADGAPRELPRDGEFDTHIGGKPAAYEQAWLACRMVAERYGEDQLVALYRATAGGAGIEVALADTLGITPAGLTADWRAYLGKLAG
ncbi:gluzincin family metallopeptidase [Motilibacter deserti]|uniref:Uncharacterized protein n=1 Tax=Motilibacter deserti TaxID=2714956 RepID=A0ABX0GRM2_9ACTN|nr:hypothetical protein [Motilibacter deserti]